MNPPSTPRPLGLRRTVLLALLGFASGLPLYLTGSTLKAWMTDEHLSLATIGLFSYATLPYSLKILWAPLLDRYALPLFGRRRGWMLLMQLGMAAALWFLARRDPHLGLWPIAGLAVAVAFTSATFDIAVDAWRAEALDQVHLGLGNSIHITGYRLAMLTSGGLALILAQWTDWRFTYLMMACLTLLGLIATLLAPSTDARAKAPRTLREAVVEPLRDLLKRPGISLLLSFTVCYKLGDWLAESMTVPFLMRGVGFSKAEIGSVQKTTAMVAILLGGLLGGWMLTKMRLRSALWICGFVQAGSILGFWVISLLGRHLVLLIGANILENFAFGMGGSAFAALLMGSCNLKYTGTQYALFSALMALPRTFFAGFTGFLAQRVGWTLYFPICALAAIPGFLLLVFYDRWGLPEDDELKG
jgi:PAT family beta-lactamase induction signal transducer AmpG